MRILFCFLNLFIYLFDLSYCMQDLHCIMQDLYGVWARECGTWAPEHAGSVVVTLRLSCSTACGTLVPLPGVEPASPALQGGFLTTGPPVKSQVQGSWLGWLMEKAMAPHSSTPAWKIPWTVGYDWSTSLSLFTFMHWRRKWQPTPVFLLGESLGRGSLVGCRLWGHTESDTTEVT